MRVTYCLLCPSLYLVIRSVGVFDVFTEALCFSDVSSGDD